MTYDKQNNGNLAKPFTPTLSAAFHRSNKAPLTPKLANPGSGYPARRLAQPDHPYSTPSKDDPPAVPTFLSANVTPRSGPRTTRRDGAVYSPTNTPPAPSPHTPYSQSTLGYGRRDRSPARGVKPEQSRSLKAKSVLESQSISRPSSVSEVTSGTPLFFHASDARSAHPLEPPDPPRPRPLGKTSPASSFIYANGDQELKTLGEQSGATSTSAKRRSGGLPRPPPASKPTPSPASRLSSPMLSAAPLPTPEDARLPFVSNTDNGLEILPRLSSPPSSTIGEKPFSPPIRHTKSSSVDSSRYRIHSYDGLGASPVILSGSDYDDGMAPMMSEHIPTLRPRIFSNGSSISTDTYPPAPLSPGKSDAPSEAALNARTERKIMDLEISNSSLLAINRTLEREMRQQKAELRRFRRLSRSGRISMAPSGRSFSGVALSTTSEQGEGESELSTRSREDTSDVSDEDSIVDESIMSPGSLAEHDAKHLVNDEKRVMLDLARHQEVLGDSQKMNQSLKRCLGWTEELIREGQRALEYSVHVQDIELGGRVLAPEELGEIGESRRGLLSPSTEYNALLSPVQPSSPEVSFVESPSLGIYTEPFLSPDLTT